MCPFKGTPNSPYSHILHQQKFPDVLQGHHHVEHVIAFHSEDDQGMSDCEKSFTIQEGSQLVHKQSCAKALLAMTITCSSNRSYKSRWIPLLCTLLREIPHPIQYQRWKNPRNRRPKTQSHSTLSGFN